MGPYLMERKAPSEVDTRILPETFKLCYITTLNATACDLDDFLLTL